MNPDFKMPPMPPRIAKLPRKSIYPVPFFVAKIDGVYDFRIVRPETMQECIEQHLCWICGEKMGKPQCFVVGPMCVVNHTSAEPPSHRECAEFAVQACPFMLNPQMVRREDEQTKALESNVAGQMIKRNPGVMALWTTKFWSIFGDGRGGALFRFTEPVHVSWWREGRRATTEEIMESIDSGLPNLRAMIPPGDTASEGYLNDLVDKAKALVLKTSERAKPL